MPLAAHRRDAGATIPSALGPRPSALAFPMPPMTSLRVSALADLARQLRFIPAATARRHLLRAEALIPEIDAERNYPEDWVGWKITGYRAEIDQPSIITGSALLGDLPGLIERLSAAAHLTLDEHPGWLTTADLGSRWNLTRRTLERYRRLGLAGRRVRRGDARWVVLYDPAHLAWFAARHADRLAADRPERFDAPELARIARWAVRYRARLGWTRQRIAARLAQRLGRSEEAIRRVLARGGVVAARARTPPSEARAAARRALRGESAITGHASRAASRRLAARERWAALRAALDAAPAPDAAGHAARFADDSAAWLAPASVREGLGRPVPRSLAGVRAEAAAAGWPDAVVERERAAAAWYLRWRARQTLGGLNPREPAAAGLDAAVTDLRHEARLRVELVRSELRATLEAIAGFPGVDFERVPAAAAAALLEACVDALIDAAERYDPFHRGRLAAPAGLGVSRALARWAAGLAGDRAGAAAIADGRPRASAVVDPAGVRLGDWAHRVVPWAEWIEPPEGVREGLEQLEPAARSVLARRMGWDGLAPATVDAAAAALGLTPARVRRIERAGLAALAADASGSRAEGGA